MRLTSVALAVYCTAADLGRVGKRVAPFCSGMGYHCREIFWKWNICKRILKLTRLGKLKPY